MAWTSLNPFSFKERPTSAKFNLMVDNLRWLAEERPHTVANSGRINIAGATWLKPSLPNELLNVGGAKGAGQKLGANNTAGAGWWDFSGSCYFGPGAASLYGVRLLGQGGTVNNEELGKVQATSSVSLGTYYLPLSFAPIALEAEETVVVQLYQNAADATEVELTISARWIRPL